MSCLFARISIGRINKEADSGHPSLTPLSRLKNTTLFPLLRTVDFMLLYIIWIYSIIFSPKLTCFKTLNKKCQFRESKAFSKSILMTMADVFVSSVKKEMSWSNLMFSPMYLFVLDNLFGYYWLIKVRHFLIYLLLALLLFCNRY